MAWRTVMRRIPTRSLTVVGDIAQTGSAAGARSWDDMLDRYVKGRWREERLLVNYRTPAEIMEVAADVLEAVAPEQEPPESVRTGGAPPRAVRLGADELPEGLPRLVESELTEIGEGRLALITPDATRDRVAALLAGPLGERVSAAEGAAEGAAGGAAGGADALDSPVAVLTVTRAKGLEFDAVIVLSPDEILRQSPKGGQDLYVAVTRATRRLTVVHAADLPEALRRLASPACPAPGSRGNGQVRGSRT
jgi:DNA helicase IV